MSHGPVQIGDTWYLWGLAGASDTASLVLEDTGLTVGGQTLYRIVPGASGTVPEPLVDDETGEILIDDATGNVLWDG